MYNKNTIYVLIVHMYVDMTCLLRNIIIQRCARNPGGGGGGGHLGI